MILFFVNLSRHWRLEFITCTAILLFAFRPSLVRFINYASILTVAKLIYNNLGFNDFLQVFIMDEGLTNILR